jgi:DNA-binding HxlR family transcriptional regulator
VEDADPLPFVPRPRRFGELRSLLPGIRKKMLIQDLRQVQESNLLVRMDYQLVPPKVEHSIKPFGRELGKSMAPLCARGEKQEACAGNEIPAEKGFLEHAGKRSHRRVR